MANVEGEGEAYRAEKLLRQSEQTYRTLAEQANEGIVIAQDGVVKYANPRMEAMTGYSREQAVGSSFLRYVHPEERERITDWARRRLAGEQLPTRYESALLSKDGHRIDVELSVAIITYAGAAAHLLMVTDITERKRTEQQLWQAYERDEAILATSMDGFLVTGTDGGFRDCNEAYCQLVGYSREELLELSISDLDAAESAEETAAHIRQVVQTGSDRFETRHRGKDGKTVDLEISAMFVELPRECFFVSFARDITQRKQAEQERERLIAELTDALDDIKVLRGLLPICASCKKIRDDEGYWHQIEGYISEHSDAQFTHGICPECSRRLYPELSETDGDDTA